MKKAVDYLKKSSIAGKAQEKQENRAFKARTASTMASDAAGTFKDRADAKGGKKKLMKEAEKLYFKARSDEDKANTRARDENKMKHFYRSQSK